MIEPLLIGKSHFFVVVITQRSDFLSYKTDFIIDYIDEKESKTECVDYKLTYYDMITLDINTYKSSCANEAIANFIYDIFNHYNEWDYWIMVQDKNSGTTNHIKCTTLDDYIKRMSYFSSIPTFTCYFIPTTFDGWRCDKNAIHTSTLFVDIDGVNINLNKMTDSEVINWLIETYHVPNAYLPRYLMVSGHGLHLYFPIEELNLPKQEATRRYYTKQLISYYKGDIACLNPSRIMRCPTSYNQKDDIPIKSRLIEIPYADSTDIKRLDYYIDKNADNYFESEKKRIAQKKRDTRNANKGKKITRTTKQTQKPAIPSLKEIIDDIIDYDTIYEQQTLPIPNYDYFDDEPAQAEPDMPDEFHQTFPNLSYDNNFNKGNRYLNIVKDLNNYFVRRKGNLPHKRDIFIHILTTVLVNAKVSYLDGQKTISNYLSPDFYEEGLKIYDNTYDLMVKGSMYHYSNTRIAELLEFTTNDFKHSFGSYNEESQIERKKKYNSKRCAKGKQQKKFLYEYIASHMDSPVKEIAIIFDVSKRTVIRYRNKIKNATS